MEDTELQSAVGIVEDDEGSAEENDVLTVVDRHDQDASVAVGLLVVPAQVTADIVLFAGWQSEGHVQSVEESGVQSDEESDVQSDEEPDVHSVEEPDVHSGDTLRTL